MIKLDGNYSKVYLSGGGLNLNIEKVIQSDAFPQEIMTYILLPQQISQLDTFTLEERIDAIEQLQNSAAYAHILIIAKLELIQRLDIQEFGRKLANDQYQLEEEEEIIMPKIISRPILQATTYKNGGLQSKKEIIAKLQMNMASGVSFLKVGKPSVQHRYKPVKTIIPPKETERKFLKAKKQDISVKKKFSTLKSSSARKYPIQIQKQDQIKIKGCFLKNILTQTKKEQVPKKLQPIEVIGQFSLKEKLKKQVEMMKIEFRQNDAYDDMNEIMLMPQNLILEQLKLKDLQESQVVTQISQREQVDTPPYQAHDTVIIEQIAQFKQNQHSEIFQEIHVPNQNNLQSKYENGQNKFMQQISKESTPYTQTKQESIYGNFERNYQNEFKEQNRFSLQQQSSTTKKLPKPSFQTIKPIQFGQTKQSSRQYSKSFKSIPKRSHQNLPTAQIDKYDIEIVQNKYDYVNSHTSHQVKSNSLKMVGKEQLKNKAQLLKMTSNNFLKAHRAQIFPYHTIIPSFSRLFPHSKNLLITLRNTQQNLKLHFIKSIDQRSKDSQYLRLNQHNITFRVISQSQKAKKHSNLFNINLDSFYKRGAMMISRVNQQNDETVDNLLLYRVVRTKEQVYDIINCSFHRTKNWHQLPHGMQLKMSWNLLWTWSKPQIDLTDLFYFQKVNHFIGNKQIARKDLLKKNIQNIKKLNAKMKSYFDIIPQTFLLPGQNIAFIKKFRQSGMKDSLNYWILKPVGLSRGRGIELVNKLEDVVFSQPVVLQKYISNPLLIDGYKFDMRIYVLVTSMNPLQAFIYKQGFARLSTQKYSLDEELMDNKFIHLTNFSINKQNMIKKEMTALESLGGCKITLKMLNQKLSRNGVQWNKIQKQIEQIILKSLVSCMNTIPNNPNCFQLFGYDIFIDTNLKCWLLQVNSSPSLQKQYTLDQIIKQQLVDDIIEIVNPVSYDRIRLLEIVQRRRKEAEGLKSSITTSSNSTWQLDEDLHYILHGKTLRRYGQPPSINNFKMLAPSQRYFSIIKTLQQYKVDPIIKGENINI